MKEGCLTDLLLITGLSGAGKSKTIAALEDIGFYCVDNLPPRMLSEFAQEVLNPNNEINQRTAVVIDARSGSSFRNLYGELSRLREMTIPFKILFLTAREDILLYRYKETRRRHPLLDECRGDIQKAIAEERNILTKVHEMADYTIDTSLLTSSQLRDRVTHLFEQPGDKGMLISCISFGFRKGIPSDADLVFDVRCLPNPFYVPELREFDGTYPEVTRYVMNSEEGEALLSAWENGLELSIPLYLKEGKSQLVIAVGCTGGKHRSVAVADRFAETIRKTGYEVTVTHRDKDL